MNRKEPVRKGAAKVPVIMQLEALECGAACLAMILAYYGKWIPLEKVRADCGVSRDGSNAGSICKAAAYYGLEALAYSLEPEELMKYAQFPCIIHWNFDHFVVLDGFKKNRAYINDPGRGFYHVDMKTFDENFTGVCMMFKPTAGFQPSGKPKSVLTFLRKRAELLKQPLLLLSLTIAAFSAAEIMRPALGRAFIDGLMTGAKPGWVRPFFILLLIVAFAEVILTAIRSIAGIRISGKADTIGSSSFMWKVLRMPMEFFSQRMAGDIQNRQISNAQIADTMINTLAPLAVNSVMLVFYLIIMFRVSWKLALIGLGSLAVNALLSRKVAEHRVNITRVSMKETAKLNSMTVSGLEMIETIKSSGAENEYFAKWAGHLARVNAEKVRLMRINQYLGQLPQFIVDLSNSLVLFLGMVLTLRGEFTVGGIMTFQGFMASFMLPALTFVNAGQILQEMNTEMERIDDVMEYPEDEVFSREESEELKKLSGSLEVKDLTFGYSRLAAPAIEGISFSVESGKTIALVGDSGCGKSTVAKLLTGLYKPWSGEILYDGKPLSEISRSVFTGSVAMVDQDIILFEDTISANIRMWDKSIEDFEVILAARDAQIYDDIMKRPEGFRTRLTEGGKNFSGGQRQRIEIARVLAQDPTLIIMDEATSALDALTEYEVVKAIRERGISCIVVAHRLSTIRSCDEILVLKEGHIAARGTHQELMKNCALYQELVTSG